MQKLFLSVTLLVLAACSTNMGLSKSNDKKAEQRLTDKGVVVSSTEGPDLRAIERNNIPSGKCGMLLWTSQSQKPVMVFRSIVGELAEMNIEDAPVQLVLVNQTGERRMGISAVQNYKTADTAEEAYSVELAVDFGVNFEGGAFVEEGIAVIEDAQKWRRLVPVAGLVGCR